MIGIDGGDLKFIREFVDHLPNLRRQIEAGQIFNTNSSYALLFEDGNFNHSHSGHYQGIIRVFV